MKKNQKTTNNPSAQGVADALKNLVEKAKKVTQDINGTGEEALKEIDDLATKVNAGIDTIDGAYADLDKAEEEAGNELDTLVLKQAEDLATIG